MHVRNNPFIFVGCVLQRTKAQLDGSKQIPTTEVRRHETEGQPSDS